MEYIIKGGSFPIVECKLKAGESMVTQSGSMCWMDAGITMDTSTNGGMKKVVGRLFTQENLFQNIYTSTKDDLKITFGTCVPGSIIAVKLTQGQSIVCQKSSFLASYGNIELSVFFNKKIGVGLFGGEGFLMQKLTGEGVVFLEIDGSSLEFDLKENEQMVLSTGYLVSMSETCSIDIQVVKGIKNILIGGEGIFNTLITGPGKVVTQTMPLARLANSMIPFLPIPTDNNSAMSTNTNVASSVINMLTKK